MIYLAEKWHGVRFAVHVIQFVFKQWDRSAFLLSLYGAGGFLISVLRPTLLDPLLDNPMYGYRTYPLGIWVSVFAGLVFVFLYRSNVMEKNILKMDDLSFALNRGCFSFLSILVPMVILLPNFLPELPHTGFVNSSIAYAAIVSLASYLHNYSPDYSFVENTEIAIKARVELLRTIYNSYYVGLALFVTLAVGVATMPPSTHQMYTKIEEIIMLEMAGRINLFYQIFGLFWGMAFQIFTCMYIAQQQFRKIKTR